MILISFVGFLLSSCASVQPDKTSFDAEWSICRDLNTGTQMACLKEEDVVRLREILLRCEDR